MDVKRNLLPLTGKASLRRLLEFSCHRECEGGRGGGEGGEEKAEWSKDSTKEWGRGCLSAAAAGLGVRGRAQSESLR